MIPALLALSLALGVSPVQDPPAPAQQPPEVIDRHPIAGPDILRTYEVRDLLSLGGAQHEGQLGYVGEPETGPDAEMRQWRKARIDLLTEILTREVQPQPDATIWKLRITQSGTLVLHATLPQHEWVQAFLDLNRSKERMVLVESHWIEGPKGSFERMGIPAGTNATVIEAKDRDRLLAACKDDARYSPIRAPRLLVNPTATGTIYCGETLAYVKGFKLETVQPGDARIADPQIEHIEEGFQLRASALLVDALRVSLELDASNTTVRRPIPTRTVRIAPDLDTLITIAEPEIDSKAVHARCTLGSTGVVAFRSPCAGHEEREFLILLSARSMNAAELKALAPETRASGAEPSQPPAPAKPR